MEVGRHGSKENIKEAPECTVQLHYPINRWHDECRMISCNTSGVQMGRARNKSQTTQNTYGRMIPSLQHEISPPR